MNHSLWLISLSVMIYYFVGAVYLFESTPMIWFGIILLCSVYPFFITKMMIAEQKKS